MENSQINTDCRVQIEHVDTIGFQSSPNYQQNHNPDENVVYLSIQELTTNNSDSETINSNTEPDFFDYSEYMMEKPENGEEQHSDSCDGEADKEAHQEHNQEENLNHTKNMNLLKILSGVADKMFFSSSSTSSDEEDLKMLKLFYMDKRKRLVKRRKKTNKTST